MEEFRAPLADRLALTLLNRKQITARDFEREESGGVFIKEESRKTILNAWQERKKGTIIHPFLKEKTTIGLLLNLQAIMLARYLRGDIDCYPPFILK
jgi:CRISPR-associated protein Cas1